ncbi:hypothetical protein [Corynebacterium sp.]|uniref:hypothetical protein n=1 Tax=Corynebacterium sp. TaxID=1720 RepID=UPI0026DFE8FC|nr:hypothetical protein [Corynebacterium sp.]MDO5511860.1 hypothetical protein [Corynebacterium sp.]
MTRRVAVPATAKATSAARVIRRNSAGADPLCWATINEATDTAMPAITKGRSSRLVT